ncbi:MAG: hypothetical protein SH850_11690 [Planctomycetaceae bacterium]|nr:hypothetical protein [Planctomycetaceae bacterium]
MLTRYAIVFDRSDAESWQKLPVYDCVPQRSAAEWSVSGLPYLARNVHADYSAEVGPTALRGAGMAKKKTVRRAEEAAPHSLNGAAKKTSKAAAKATLGFKEVKLDYSNADSQRATFANTFAVQHDQHEFHLLFFQALPPLIVAGDVDREKKLAALESLKPECVARIVVAADRMPSIIQALVENYSKHQVRTTDSVKSVKVDGNPLK